MPKQFIPLEKRSKKRAETLSRKTAWILERDFAGNPHCAKWKGIRSTPAKTRKSSRNRRIVPHTNTRSEPVISERESWHLGS